VVGRLVALDFSVVAARIDGPVERVAVHVGDRVAEGALLATLDRDRLRAEVALREAEIEERTARLSAAEATVSLYRQEVDRLEGLRTSAAFSQARYDDARAEAERSVGQRSEAEAALARARVALDLARLELGYATIEAPFPGVVSERHVDEGEYVDIGAPIVTLINDRDLEIEAAVPGELVDNLDRGTEMTARLDADVTVAARVRAVVPLEDTRTRTRRVRFTADLEALGIPLASNQSAIVFVPVGRPRDVVTVDKDAVLSGPDGHSVFVVTDEGTAEPRGIEIGRAVGNRFEVVSGLAPGDVVVTRGNESLRPGQPVRAEGS
jgi:RND family efflux transporter MFP subunit